MISKAEDRAVELVVSRLGRGAWVGGGCGNTTVLICFGSIPLLAASGKLDKKALPPYDSQQSVNGNCFEDAAITETERQLLPIWREILGAKHVDVQESFFDLGG